MIRIFTAFFLLLAVNLIEGEDVAIGIVFHDSVVFQSMPDIAKSFLKNLVHSLTRAFPDAIYSIIIEDNRNIRNIYECDSQEDVNQKIDGLTLGNLQKINFTNGYKTAESTLRESKCQPSTRKQIIVISSVSGSNTFLGDFEGTFENAAVTVIFLGISTLNPQYLKQYETMHDPDELFLSRSVTNFAESTEIERSVEQLKVYWDNMQGDDGFGDYGVCDTSCFKSRTCENQNICGRQTERVGCSDGYCLDNYGNIRSGNCQSNCSRIDRYSCSVGVCLVEFVYVDVPCTGGSCISDDGFGDYGVCDTSCFKSRTCENQNICGRQTERVGCSDGYCLDNYGNIRSGNCQSNCSRIDRYSCSVGVCLVEFVYVDVPCTGGSCISDVGVCDVRKSCACEDINSMDYVMNYEELKNRFAFIVNGYTMNDYPEHMVELLCKSCDMNRLQAVVSTLDSDIDSIERNMVNMTMERLDLIFNNDVSTLELELENDFDEALAQAKHFLRNITSCNPHLGGDRTYWTLYNEHFSKSLALSGVLVELKARHERFSAAVTACQSYGWIHMFYKASLGK